MKLRVKSPLMRSVIITSVLTSRYLAGKAKLAAYQYLQPPKIGKADYRAGTAIPRFATHSALHPEPYEAEQRPVYIYGGIIPGQFKVLKLMTHSELNLRDIYSEFELNFEDLHCQSYDLAQRLLNGPFPIELSPDPQHPKILQKKIVFSKLSDSERCKLPDVTARFVRHKEALKFHEIVIEDRHLGRHVYTPSSPPEHWRMAQSILLGTWSYYGELYYHVLHSHIDIEQYAIALHRNLTPQNPLFKVLIPHVAGLGPVNVIADETLIGPQGIFTGRDLLSAKAIDHYLLEEMKEMNWKTWRPMKPLGKFHQYAVTGELYWKLVTEYLDQYFECFHDETLKHTAELKAFAKDLSAHCVHQGAGKKRKQALSDLMSDDYEELIDNLKILCRFIIFKTTFIHSWVHLMRTDTPTAYRQRFFEDPADYFAFQESKEALISIANQLSVEYAARNLTRSCIRNHYPSILKGEDTYGISDIFKSTLEKYRGEFRTLGLNIDFLMTGIH